MQRRENTPPPQKRHDHRRGNAHHERGEAHTLVKTDTLADFALFPLPGPLNPQLSDLVSAGHFQPAAIYLLPRHNSSLSLEALPGADGMPNADRRTIGPTGYWAVMASGRSRRWPRAGGGQALAGTFHDELTEGTPTRVTPAQMSSGYGAAPPLGGVAVAPGD
ncbi:hypothetical protein SAMN05421869_10831 [Nonomuraea jiangxiensis]|uniref:Uncharacterized protein n=1 Tax=Nonomuraea jiangxiensis TaxID=633440 RepID=A0A1G8PU13_9ACTN|nr:hypothetical protein SAMN05421869_10831 [Nonomuraea jiangxiensis]